MQRRATSKILWLVRGAALFWGAVLTLALIVGAASVALGANGGNFILGQNNTATLLTRLTGDVQGAAMQVQNIDDGADDSALSLVVQDGEAPMRVSSERLVNSLNADYVDGRSFECPTGTLFHEGVCIERNSRGSAAYDSASTDCLNEGRASTNRGRTADFPQPFGTGLRYQRAHVGEGARRRRSLLYGSFESENGATVLTPLAALWPYRCVVPSS